MALLCDHSIACSIDATFYLLWPLTYTQASSWISSFLVIVRDWDCLVGIELLGCRCWEESFLSHVVSKTD